MAFALMTSLPARFVKLRLDRLGAVLPVDATFALGPVWPIITGAKLSSASSLSVKGCVRGSGVY